MPDIPGEDGDGLVVGPLFGRGGKFAFDRGAQQPFVAVGHGLCHKPGSLAVAFDKESLQAGECLLVVGGDGDAQNTLVLAAAHGQNLVRGTPPQRFAPSKVVAVLVALRLFALDHLGGDDTALLKAAAHRMAGPFVLGHPLGDDVAGPLDGTFGVEYFGIDEAAGIGLNAVVALRHDNLGQWFEPMFAGNLGSGAPAWFVGQVYIFEFGRIPARVDTLAQLVGQFPLLADGRKNRLLAFVQFAQPVVSLFDIPDLYLVERAGSLLAVAADEGNGGTAVEQLDGLGYLRFGNTQRLGYQFVEQGIIHESFFSVIMVISGRAPMRMGRNTHPIPSLT